MQTATLSEITLIHGEAMMELTLPLTKRESETLKVGDILTSHWILARLPCDAAHKNPK